MSDSAILDAIAATFLGVPGLNDEAIYSAGGGEIEGVKEFPDVLDGGFPATVVLGGDRSITAGSWERERWAVEAGVWVPDQAPRAEAYRTLLDLASPVRAAFRASDRAQAADPAVQAVLITEIGAVVGRQWQRGEGSAWYLVLPFTFEVTVNRAVTYLSR